VRRWAGRREQFLDLGPPPPLRPPAIPLPSPPLPSRTHTQSLPLSLSLFSLAGLNGNPIGDVGAGLLAKALRGNKSLRDIGITLSDMTDAGVEKLALALNTLPNLRFVYLYSQGFKAAVNVSDAGKATLRRHLPPFATAALNHAMSRYLKTCD